LAQIASFGIRIKKINAKKNRFIKSIMNMRASWKLPYIEPAFFNNNYKKKGRVLTKKRNSLIPLKFSGKKVILYNGCWFKKAPTITSSFVNFKIGEFIPTRSTKYTHLKKLKKKGSKRKK